MTMLLRQLLHLLPGAVLCLGAALGLAQAQPMQPRPPEPTPSRLALAWLDVQGQAQAVWLNAQGQTVPNPDLLRRPLRLGSLWKLVAYAQWVESRVPQTPYRCTGGNPEEVYCCTPGESIDRAQALVRSCSLYFSAARVPWQHAGGAAMAELPAALRQAVAQGKLGPDTVVDLSAWLRWLSRWPANLRAQAQDDLLDYWLGGPGRSALAQVAGSLRVKTFTLEVPGGTRYAGASGWTALGTPLWFGMSGSSKNVVPQWAAAVVNQLNAPEPPQAAQAEQTSPVRAEPVEASLPAFTSATPCIRVHYFAQYPLQSITRAGTPQDAVQPGELNGHYVLRFQSGQVLRIQSRHDLRWQTSAQGPHIMADLPLDDYVARVIDREAQAQPQHAAWALAIAARSYVLAQGQPHEGCLDIDDASRTQRVAPRPPTHAAMQAAQATSGMVVRGGYAVPGRYHAHQASDGVLSWQKALSQANVGMFYTDILRHAYPRAVLGAVAQNAAVACVPLASAQAWLAREQVRWVPQLAGVPGFTQPGPIAVCLLHSGNPHAQNSAGRIDVSGFATQEQRLALTHEYLHLAFAHHPRSLDEAFIENTARQLMGLNP